MTTQDYSLAWEQTQEIATQYNNEVRTIVVEETASPYFFSFSTFLDSFVTTMSSDTAVSHASVYTALLRIETWLYGYCTAFAKPLA